MKIFNFKKVEGFYIGKMVYNKSKFILPCRDKGETFHAIFITKGKNSSFRFWWAI